MSIGSRIIGFFVASLLACSFTGVLRADENELIWAVRAGGTNTCSGQGISALADGSSLVAGNFRDTAVFGPGEANETELVSAGGVDIFVARYGPGGVLEWATRAGGGGNDNTTCISALSDGSSLVTGRFFETAVFGAGEANETELVSAGGDDIFVARYNADGTLAWATRAGGTAADRGESVSALADGSSLVAGWFRETAVFGPGEANETELVSAGGSDIFVARYNADGTLAWAVRAGGTSACIGYSISALADGSSLVTGRFFETAVFGAGEANETELVSAGWSNIFVARYNADGTLDWATRAGGSAADDRGESVSALADGSSLVTGWFRETAVFGAGEANETELVSAGATDIFVARYNADGTLGWATWAGGTGVDHGYGVSALADGSSLVTGFFSVTAVFGAGEANETELVSAGQRDIFVARYGPDGALEWAKRTGGTATEEGRGISTLADGSWLLTGYFRETVVFGAGEANETELVSAGASDTFVARYFGYGWLLPAGAVSAGGTLLDTYVLVANPNAQPAPVRVEFVGRGGFIAQTEVEMAPTSRRTFLAGDFVDASDPSADSVSTIVTSTGGFPIFCERAMYFPGGTGAANWIGGNDTVGISEPATEWNLPEGATHIFDQFIHVLNPGASWVTATAVFMNQFGATWSRETLLAPKSNWTIDVGAVTGDQGEVSTRVVGSGAGVAVDRTMYWPKGGPSAWRGGHCSRGISGSATTWYLAEGANHLFDHYILVSNPSAAQAADVHFTFMDKDGDTAFHRQTVGTRSRYTVKVNDIPGWGNKDQVSTTVESQNGVPVFAERAMYFPKGGPAVWLGGHDTIGAPAAAAKWYLPEGANHFFDHYVLVFNPHPAESAQVRITFMDRFGVTHPHDRLIGPNTRYTVKVNDHSPGLDQGQISTVVESLTAGVPVIAERAMYFPKGGPAVWQAGHATIGIAE